MAIGYVHLFALPGKMGDSGKVQIPRYQFTFSPGGHTFSKILEEQEIQEFLLDELGLRVDVVHEALELLDSTGNVTIPDVEINENDTPVLGLMEVGADY